MARGKHGIFATGNACQGWRQTRCGSCSIVAFPVRQTESSDAVAFFCVIHGLRQRRLREKTSGRKQARAEVLIREDRDRRHRDEFWSASSSMQALP